MQERVNRKPLLRISSDSVARRNDANLIEAEAESRTMNGIVNKAGDVIVSLGNKATHLATSVNHQTWLVLSVVVVMIGFYFLKSNR